MTPREFRKLARNIETQQGPVMPVRLAVDLALREAGTVEGAADRLGISATTLRDWLAAQGLEVRVVRVAMVVKGG